MIDDKKADGFGGLAKAIKTAYTAEPAIQKIPTVSKIAVGNQVKFLGGNVFLSASTSTVVAVKKEGMCEVTQIHNGVHKYRCRSTDNSGIDGWVDECNLAKL